MVLGDSPWQCCVAWPCHEPHAEHVERGHEGGDDTEDPQDGEPDGSVVSGLHRDLQDQILGPESAEEGESGD